MSEITSESSSATARVSYLCSATVLLCNKRRISHTFITRLTVTFATCRLQGEDHFHSQRSLSMTSFFSNMKFSILSGFLSGIIPLVSTAVLPATLQLLKNDTLSESSPGFPVHKYASEGIFGYRRIADFCTVVFLVSPHLSLFKVSK